MRILPSWPGSRYLELAPEQLGLRPPQAPPAELDTPFGCFTVTTAWAGTRPDPRFLGGELHITIG